MRSEYLSEETVNVDSPQTSKGGSSVVQVSRVLECTDFPAVSIRKKTFVRFCTLHDGC